MHPHSPRRFEVNVRNGLHIGVIYVQIRATQYTNDISASPPTPPTVSSFVRIAPYQNTPIPVIVDGNQYHTYSLTVYYSHDNTGCVANQVLLNRPYVEVVRSEHNPKDIIIRYAEQTPIDYLLSSMRLPIHLINTMKTHGWTDPRLWGEIKDDDLVRMGFKKGHIALFFEKYRNISNPNAYIRFILVTSWNLPLHIYCNMIKHGWLDPCDWHSIQDIHFRKMGFKDGHIIKFKKSVAKNAHLLVRNAQIPSMRMPQIHSIHLSRINVMKHNSMGTRPFVAHEESKSNNVEEKHNKFLDEIDVNYMYHTFVSQNRDTDNNISDDDDDDDAPFEHNEALSSQLNESYNNEEEEDTVISDNSHPLPVIDKIKCKGMTAKACRVKWKAYLSQEDMDSKAMDSVETKLYMQIINENDEKDDMCIESEFIEFKSGKDQYECQLDDLKRGTLYKMKILIYEDERLREEVTDSSFTFKTLRYDFYEKPFVYASDYDQNGILYYLGTAFGTAEWVNPAELGLVKLTSTGWEEGSLNDFVGRKGVMSYASNKVHSFTAVDFGENIKVKVNCYTLRHSNAHKGFYLRNWNFEGSNDNKKWNAIKKHKNDKTFQKRNQSHTWTMNNCNQYYRYFRIRMTKKDSSNCWYMMATGFEIYGYLTGNMS